MSEQVTLPDILPHLSQEEFHPFRILLTDNIEKLPQFLPYLLYLLRGVWIEEYLGKQEIILREQPLCDVHMLLEGGTRCILMLHHRGEHQRGGKGYGK